MIFEWGDIESQLSANGFDVEGIRQELISGWQFNSNMAELRQRQVAGEVNTTPHLPIEGIGECFMRVDADVFHNWNAKLGKDCWNDKGFRREFMRDNPAVKVNHQPSKTSIIVP